MLKTCFKGYKVTIYNILVDTLFLDADVALQSALVRP